MRAASVRGRFAGAGFPWLGKLLVRHPVMIVAAWLAVAAVMWLSLPSLAQVTEKNPPEFLPSDAPALVAGEAMGQAFAESDSENMILVVLSNEAGLGPADEATYQALVGKLRADTANVRATQDFVHTPEMRSVMTSRDNKAWNLPVSLAGKMGTGEGQEAYRNVVQIAKDATANTSLRADVIGGGATINDLNEIGTRDQHLIELATVLMVLAILILVTGTSWRCCCRWPRSAFHWLWRSRPWRDSADWAWGWPPRRSS